MVTCLHHMNPQAFWLVVHCRPPSTMSETSVLWRQVKEKPTDVKLWKKKHAAERVRRDYRTADEVLKEASEKGAEAPRQTILDMRGPQVRRVHFLFRVKMCGHSCILLSGQES
jgi:hypothetical protein